MSDRHHRTLFICSLLLPGIGACAPSGKTTGIDSSPAPAPALTTAGMDTAPTTDLDAHHAQVRQDTEAFLAFQQQQQQAEPTIEWTRPGEATTPTTPPAIVTTQQEPPYGPAEEPAKTIASSTGDEPQSDARLRQSMIDFSRELYVGSTWSERPLRELMVLASMAMLDPDRAIDPAAIPDLTDDERLLLKTMQQYFIEVGNSLDSNTNPWLAMTTATDELQQRLKLTPDLELPTLALCTRVRGFGDFDEWTIRNDQDHYSFIAHSAQPVIIYLEMEGFTSDFTNDDLWETVTSQHLTIYSDRDGIPVWKEDWQSASDHSRKQRRDYFTVQKFTLPRGLSVGRYQLKVRVRDEKTGAETEQNIPFTMTAGVLD